MLIFFAILSVISVFTILILLSKLSFAKQVGRRAVSDRKGIVNFLNSFTLSLIDIEAVEKAIELVARYLADVIEGESLCIFTVLDDGNEKHLQAVASTGMFPAFHPTSDYVWTKSSYLLDNLRQEKIPINSENILGLTAINKKGLLIEKVNSETEDIKKLFCTKNIHSFMAVPMVIEGEILGIVCVVNSRNENYYFNEDDLHLMESLANQAALAQNMLEIYSELGKQQRIKQELYLANKMQLALLPKQTPQWGHYSISAFNQAAEEIGGDFYDFVEIDEDNLLVVIADASGKGVPACMITAMCRSFLRALAKKSVNLEALLQELNSNLFRDTDGSRFVTMGCCIINKRTDTVHYARAGHTELFIKEPKKDVNVLYPEGTALGLLPDKFNIEFETVLINTSPGNKILMFSDGINEAANDNYQMYGIEKLKDFWDQDHDENAQELIEMIIEDVNRFAGEMPQADDQTLVVIERTKD